MRIFLIAASALAITACSQAEEADPADTTEPAAAEVSGPVAIDGNPSAGMYRVTTEEGEVYMEDAKPDGTYVTTKDGEVVETGTWEQPSPDQWCSQVDEEYIDEEEDGTRKCNTEQIDENGVWTSVNSEGKTAVIERADS